MKVTTLFVFIISLSTFCCKRDPFQIDVTAEKISITVSRFEMDLFSADPSALEDSIPVWKQKYGNFLQHFSYIIKAGNIDDPGFADRLRQFVTDHSNYLIYKRTQEVFPRLDTFILQLTDAFKHYHHYFPAKPIPRIVTYVSGLNQSAITDDSLLAIGLDKYLGTREELYRQIGIYNYLTINMHPKKLVSDGMMFWGETEFPFHDSVNNLLANMVYRGRLLYFTSSMIPAEPDSIKWGYTAKSLDFCKSNEKYMWTRLIEKKYIFSTDQFTIDKFILEGPFTKDFGRESPARAAVWLGYRIVSSFMEKNPDINLSRLMQETNYMKILNLSEYNP